MISRYKPTYSYADLLHSYRASYKKDITKSLVKRLQQYYNVKHVFLFETGKMAITVLLKANGKPGSVLTPAYNCIAVPEAICQAGCTPLFVDAEPGRMDVSLDAFDAAVTQDVKVIMPVHLFGIPWRIDDYLKRYARQDVLVVEDAAPAFGARLNGRCVGQYSDAFIISFHWTKVLSGEAGGGLLTNNDALAQQISDVLGEVIIPKNRIPLFVSAWFRKSITKRTVYQLTRAGHSLLFGQKMFEVVKPERVDWSEKIHTISPFSSALILSQIDKLEENLSHRNAIAQIYHQKLTAHSQFSLPEPPADSRPSWIQYPVLVRDKLNFYKYMQGKGVDVTWSYRYSCPDTYNLAGFQNSRRVANELVGLPVYPDLGLAQAEMIGEIASNFVA